MAVYENTEEEIAHHTVCDRVPPSPKFELHIANVDLISVVANAEMKVDYTKYTDEIKTNT